MVQPSIARERTEITTIAMKCNDVGVSVIPSSCFKTSFILGYPSIKVMKSRLFLCLSVGCLPRTERIKIIPQSKKKLAV